MLTEPVEVPTTLDASPPGGACPGLPGSPTERAMAELLSEVLGGRPVPADSHFFDDLGADSMLMAQFCARVRKRPDLPSVSIKDVYQHPTVSDLAAAVAPAAPPTAPVLAELLSQVLGGRPVAPDSHFFDDLGADSMLMAQFCARVRKRPDLPSVSIKDVYQHPTVADLAAAVAPAGAAPAPLPPIEVPAPASTRQYVLCGVLQVLVILAYVCAVAVLIERGFEWISGATGLLDIYLRAMVIGGVSYTAACTFPVAAKWVLVGRWKHERIRIWSLAYVRFWAVKSLVTLNPVVFFAGTPLYTLYLRGLGARIGRGALVLSRHAPVCADLLTIGEGAVVRKEAFLTGYRATAGWIQTGAVTIGRDAFVGEKSILDIETSVGDGAQLGHVSSLYAGQSVPAGERWHGSPAQPAGTDYVRVPPAPCGRRQRVGYTLWQLAAVFGVYVPLAFGGISILLLEVPWLAGLLDPGPLAFTSASFYGTAAVAAVVLFLGGAVLSLLVMLTVPRLLDLLIEPDRAYPLYGLHYAAHRTITRLTNRKFFVELFGDSSYVVGYLRALGYHLTPVVQTGSNFGSELKHETPYLVSVGTGTVVASGQSFANADYSSSSFRVSRAAIGRNNFLGNDIVYPAGGRTGDNCLLATKVLVPVDGEVREGVGLLGSPAFEIPRTVERDTRFNHLMTPEQLPGLLAAKNRHNQRTMAFWLLGKWGFTYGLLLIGFVAADLYHALGALAIALSEAAALVFTLLYASFVERASTGFRGVRPTYCSIYQVGFWQSERFFKMQAGAGLHRVFAGTPLQSWFLRLVGVRLGRRLFDDGCGMSEKNLVTIGDDVTLNVGSFIQCHSQEDYAFKSERVSVAAGCTLGVGALVYYGVAMAEGAQLAPDSFLMKGEEVPAYARWGGNPARELRGDELRAAAAALAATATDEAEDEPAAVDRPDRGAVAAHGRHRAGRRPLVEAR